METREVILQELPRLRRFAYALTSSKADADDLVQNTVVRLLKAGLPENVAPIPWMMRVCKNLWIDELRSRSVRMKAADQIERDHEQQDDAGSRQLQGNLDLQRVNQAMASLSDEHRMTLSLIAIEGMSYAEAAEVLGVPIGTIMSRLARARKQLHQKLNNELLVTAK